MSHRIPNPFDKPTTAAILEAQTIDQRFKEAAKAFIRAKKARIEKEILDGFFASLPISLPSGKQR